MSNLTTQEKLTLVTHQGQRIVVDPFFADVAKFEAAVPVPIGEFNGLPSGLRRNSDGRTWVFTNGKWRQAILTRQQPAMKPAKPIAAVAATAA